MFKICLFKTNLATHIRIDYILSTNKFQLPFSPVFPTRVTFRKSYISELCRNTKEPVFITKNGYVDMVIMSMETYERIMFMNDVYRRLEKGEESIKAGRTMDPLDSLHEIREKYEL